jgi:hypothetical protein
VRLLVTVAALAALATPVAAQWLNYPTPGIPRTADGTPNLKAPAPRTAEGKPDLTGVWNAPIQFGQPTLDPSDMSAWAQEIVARRAEELFKARPAFRCLPSGPETFGQGFTANVTKQIVQTPGLIVVLNDDLTYRRIYMDGRALESAPFPTWMGYSVGRWEGDTLVVDSFGFNERTWLNDRGLPHTEALRMSERYHRLDVGHLRIDLTFTDASVYAKPLSLTVNMELAADTEMLEAVCETGSENWTGRSLRISAVNVPGDVLARYVGVYSGIWARRPRTVHITLSAGQLVARIDGMNESQPLVALTETVFESSEGLGYEFIVEGNQPATDVDEIHVSGNYRLARQR